MRNRNFDGIKGYLILMVVVGHIFIEPVHQNTAKQFIYFFHMPLFLAMSGYFSSTTLFSKKPAAMFRYYWSRMTLPFLISFLVIGTMALLGGRAQLNLNFVLSPYMHLWYVPALLLFVFYSHLIYRFKLPLGLILTVSAVLAVIDIAKLWPQLESDYQWLSYLGDKRFYSYYFYFLFGHFIKRHYRKELGIPLFVASLCMIPVTLGENGIVSHTLFTAIASLSAKAAIIIMVLVLCEELGNRTNLFASLSKVGEVSLAIYLWHLLPIIVLKVVLIQIGVTGDTYKALFYGLATPSLVIFVIATTYYQGKFTWLDKLIYGKK